MGVEFGELPVRIRRVVYYTLSPLEQKFWVKSVSHGIPNLFRRALSTIPSLGPALVLMVGFCNWSNAAHKRSKKKDPRLYENDT